jgi:RNA polymerase sigma-70 factor (ECF subfamily)
MEPPMTARAQATAIDEADLLRQARQGRSEAFGQLVLRYQDAVYNLCWRVCGHHEDARDLTQAAFLRAFEALERFEGKSSFYTWLFRIAANLAISHRRRRNPMASARSLDEGLLAAAAGASDDGDPVSRLQQGETHRLVQAALGEIDDEHRLVLVLRDVEGMDYERIAQVLALPKGTVKSRIHRARMALRDRLIAMGCLDAGEAQTSRSEHTS